MSKENLTIEISYIEERECYFLTLYDEGQLVVEESTGNPPPLFAEDRDDLWEHLERIFSSIEEKIWP